MTLIIGIRSQDGVVLGADSGATYTTPLGQEYTVLQLVSKLTIIGPDVVLGVSGTTGLAQAHHHELEEHILKDKKNPKARWTTISGARESMRDIFWSNGKIAWERAETVARVVGQRAAQDALHSCLVAFPIGDKACLLQFNEKCLPDEFDEKLPFVAIGSGQLLADPYLALIRDFLWPDSLPSLNDAIFAAVFTLRLAIRYAPQRLANPIEIVTLNKNSSGEWNAGYLSRDDVSEHEQMVDEMKQAMREMMEKAFAIPPTDPIPE